MLSDVNHLRLLVFALLQEKNKSTLLKVGLAYLE
jgi:hypothetical protein